MTLGFTQATPFWLDPQDAFFCFQIFLWDFQMNLRLFIINHELAFLAQSITFLPTQSKAIQMLQKSETLKPQCTQMIFSHQNMGKVKAKYSRALFVLPLWWHHCLVAWKQMQMHLMLERALLLLQNIICKKVKIQALQMYTFEGPWQFFM